MRERRALIIKMLDTFPAAANLGSESVLALARSTEGYSLEAVHLACLRFANGDVPGRDNPRMPPSASELVPQVKMIDAGIKVRDGVRPELPPAPEGFRRLPTGEIVVPIGVDIPEGFEPAGDVSVDFGHGNIDLRGKTRAEKEEIYRQGGLPPIKRIEGARPLPRLQRMGNG